MWDVAAAGPLAGILFSGTLLAIGLSQSQPGELPPEMLVSVSWLSCRGEWERSCVHTVTTCARLPYHIMQRH
jgi:hypothetical protein